MANEVGEIQVTLGKNITTEYGRSVLVKNTWMPIDNIQQTKADFWYEIAKYPNTVRRKVEKKDGEFQWQYTKD